MWSHTKRTDFDQNILLREKRSGTRLVKFMRRRFCVMEFVQVYCCKASIALFAQFVSQCNVPPWLKINRLNRIQGGKQKDRKKICFISIIFHHASSGIYTLTDRIPQFYFMPCSLQWLLDTQIIFKIKFLCQSKRFTASAMDFWMKCVNI